MTGRQRSWFPLVRHFGGWNVGAGERGVCTLLGPEGPGSDLFGGWDGTSTGSIGRRLLLQGGGVLFVL